MYTILKNIIEMDDYSVQKLSKSQPPTPFQWNTVEGTELNVDDCIGEKGKIEVRGNTEQQTYEGKNLLNPNILENGALNNEGEKTNTLFNQRVRSSTKQSISAGTYTISTDEFQVVVYRFNSKNTLYSVDKDQSWKNTPYTFTLDEDGYINIAFKKSDNSNITTSDILAQIEKGSQATSYEPYVGGPSPSPDYPQNIKKVTGDNLVKTAGKNLFDKENAKVLTAYINTSGVITKHSISRLTYVEVQPNTTYTISKLSNGFCECAFFDEEPAIGLAGGYGFVNAPFDKRVAYDGVTKAKYTFTTKETTKYFAFRMFRTDVDSNGGGAVANLQAMLDSIQLEQGSTATEYEEYKGKEFELNLWTENKFDKNGNIKNNYYLDANGGEVENTGAWFTEYYIEVKPNTLYLMQGGQNFKRICYYDKDKEFISRDNSEIDSLKVITPTNCAYVRLSNNGEYDSLEFKECIELCKIGDYKDVLFKNEQSSKYYNSSLIEGAWYKKETISRIDFNGTEDVGIPSTSVGEGLIAFRISLGTKIASDYCLALSNRFIFSARNLDEWNNGEKDIAYTAVIATANNKSAVYCRVKEDFISSAEEMKHYLAENETYVYLVRSSPTYVQITDETLITQLEALNKAKWFKGVNHWWTETNNLEPVLKGTYRQAINE